MKATVLQIRKSLIMDYLQSRPEFRVVSIREDDGFFGYGFQSSGVSGHDGRCKEGSD